MMSTGEIRPEQEYTEAGGKETGSRCEPHHANASMGVSILVPLQAKEKLPPIRRGPSALIPFLGVLVTRAKLLTPDLHLLPSHTDKFRPSPDKVHVLQAEAPLRPCPQGDI